MKTSLIVLATVTWAHPSFALGHYGAWALSMTAIMLWVRGRS